MDKAARLSSILVGQLQIPSQVLVFPLYPQVCGIHKYSIEHQSWLSGRNTERREVASPTPIPLIAYPGTIIDGFASYPSRSSRDTSGSAPCSSEHVTSSNSDIVKKKKPKHLANALVSCRSREKHITPHIHLQIVKAASRRSFSISFPASPARPVRCFWRCVIALIAPRADNVQGLRLRRDRGSNAPLTL